MSNFTDEQKKAIALAIHNGAEFFVFDGVVYEGDQNGEERAFEEWLSHNGKTGGAADNAADWRDWLNEEVFPLPDYDENGDYMVLTDSEADEKAEEYIAESLWAFNPSFLSGVTGIDEEVFQAIAANDRCESNNDAIRKLVGDEYDELVSQAIGADGRGHFLNTYDGEEHEINVFDTTGSNEYFYVYRLN